MIVIMSIGWTVVTILAILVVIGTILYIFGQNTSRNNATTLDSGGLTPDELRAKIYLLSQGKKAEAEDIRKEINVKQAELRAKFGTQPVPERLRINIKRTTVPPSYQPVAPITLIEFIEPDVVDIKEVVIVPDHDSHAVLTENNHVDHRDPGLKVNEVQTIKQDNLTKDFCLSGKVETRFFAEFLATESEKTAFALLHKKEKSKAVSNVRCDASLNTLTRFEFKVYDESNIAGYEISEDVKNFLSIDILKKGARKWLSQRVKTEMLKILKDGRVENFQVQLQENLTREVVGLNNNHRITLRDDDDIAILGIPVLKIIAHAIIIDTVVVGRI